jgi:hypothetical protein
VRTSKLSLEDFSTKIRVQFSFSMHMYYIQSPCHSCF